MSITIEDAIITKLNSLANLTAIIGTNGIWAQPAPENTPYPHLTYFTQSGRLFQGLGGSHNVRTPRITITAWSATYDDVANIIEVLVNEFVSFNGTIAGIAISNVYFEDDRENFDQGAKVFRREIDVTVWYTPQ